MSCRPVITGWEVSRTGDRLWTTAIPHRRSQGRVGLPGI